MEFFQDSGAYWILFVALIIAGVTSEENPLLGFIIGIASGIIFIQMYPVVSFWSIIFCIIICGICGALAHNIFIIFPFGSDTD